MIKLNRQRVVARLQDAGVATEGLTDEALIRAFTERGMFLEHFCDDGDQDIEEEDLVGLFGGPSEESRTTGDDDDDRLTFRLDRSFVVEELKELQEDGDDVVDFSIKSEADLVCDFCCSGLFGDVFLGDRTFSNRELVGLF